MKITKIIITVVMLVALATQLVFSTSALGAPSAEGSLLPPPNSNGGAYTGSFEIMRSYSNVKLMYANATAQSNSANVNGTNAAYYPILWYSFPSEMVAPSANGYGDIADFYSTSNYNVGYYVKLLTGTALAYAAPNSTHDKITLETETPRNGTYIYEYNASVSGTRNWFYGTGTVVGEWQDGIHSTNAVHGYGFRWTGNGACTVNITGTLVYGTAGDAHTVNIERGYEVPHGEDFWIEPYTLVGEETAGNYSYYTFTGNWTIYSETVGYPVSYFVFDAENTEVLDFVDGYNEYNTTVPTIDNNPITRISTKLFAPRTGGTKYQTITNNGTWSVDVAGYDKIQIAVNVPTTPVIPPTTSDGDILVITENGSYPVNDHRYLRVEVPQEVIDGENMFGWLINAGSAFLNFQIAGPNFTIGSMLVLIVGLSLIMWILKVFLGG